MPRRYSTAVRRRCPAIFLPNSSLSGPMAVPPATDSAPRPHTSSRPLILSDPMQRSSNGGRPPVPAPPGRPSSSSNSLPHLLSYPLRSFSPSSSPTPPPPLLSTGSNLNLILPKLEPNLSVAPPGALKKISLWAVLRPWMAGSRASRSGF